MKTRRGGSFSSGMIVMYFGVKLVKPGEAPGKYSFDQKICDTDSGFNQTKLENQHRRRGELSSVVHQPLPMSDGDIRLAKKFPPLPAKFGIPE